MHKWGPISSVEEIANNHHGGPAGQAGHSVRLAYNPLAYQNDRLVALEQRLDSLASAPTEHIAAYYGAQAQLNALEQKVDSLSERLAGNGGSLTAAIFKIDALARTVESWGGDKKDTSPSTMPARLRNLADDLIDYALELENE